jgi:hypothetical protein
MMKFHPSSFVLGLASAVALMGTRKRLRPVVIELAAAGVHFGRLALALVERQRENVEDVWAEVEERVRQRTEAVQPDARREVDGASPVA